MKTLSEFKRDVASGNLWGKIVIRFGSENIPERMTGWRKIAIYNKTNICFINEQGQKSILPLEKASLIEYDGETLTIYSPGLRELTKAEQEAINEWHIIEKSYPEYQSTYYIEQDFFKKKGMPYLAGYEKIKGQKYDFNTGKIQDDRIKGKISLKYEIKKES